MSITTYNYSAHAIEDLYKLIPRLEQDNMPEAAFATNELIKGLKNSVKFILPPGGKLFDHDMPTKGELELFKLPFPVVAAEFPAIHTEADDIDSQYNLNTCSKRIALAFEVGEKGDADYFAFPELPNEFSGATLIWPIDFIDDLQQWYPGWCGVLEFHGHHIEQTTSAEKNLAKKMLKQSGVSSLKVSPIILRRIFIPFGEIGKQQTVLLKNKGMSVEYTQTIDTTAESTAIRQMCSVLNCSNVETKTVSPSKKLNKKRAQKGKQPLFEYKILEVTPQSAKIPHMGGSHASPRIHLRRGHIRRLPEKQVWVQPCVVGEKKNGVIMKDYKIRDQQSSVAA
jgi:hypothetical protein